MTILIMSGTMAQHTELEAQTLYYNVPMYQMQQIVPDFSFDYVEFSPEMMLQKYIEYNRSISDYSVIPARFIYDIFYFRYFDISA